MSRIVNIEKIRQYHEVAEEHLEPSSAQAQPLWKTFGQQLLRLILQSRSYIHTQQKCLHQKTCTVFTATQFIGTPNGKLPWCPSAMKRMNAQNTV